MTEGMTAIADEQATPAIETQTPQTEAEASDTDLENLPEGGEDAGDGSEEGEAGESAEQAPELVEIEFNGKKINIPAELKDSFLMQSDYTRKTQEVAEMRKTVEARQAEAEAHFNVSQEILQARAALMVHDNQLEQYQNLDWKKLENEDPVGAMSAWRQFQQLKEERGNIAGYLTEQQTQRSAKAEQETANRLRETREFAEKSIPGWTSEVDEKIGNFAMKELGYSQETLLGAYSPAVYRTLHLAWLGHQLLQKQTAAPKPAAPIAQPLSKVTARANPPSVGLDDRLTADEWLKRRNAQVVKRG